MSSMDDTTRDAVARARDAVSDLAYLVGSRGGSNDLALLGEVARIADRLTATEVELVTCVQDSGAAERVEGLQTEAWLRLSARHTYPDAVMRTQAADTLRSMPRTARAWQQGVIGWGEVRAIVCEARPLNRHQRADPDQRSDDPQHQAMPRRKIAAADKQASAQAGQHEQDDDDHAGRHAGSAHADAPGQRQDEADRGRQRAAKKA
jgi:hypothetical protein